MYRLAKGREQRGFSIIETIVVVLGVAVIAAMAVPRLQRAQDTYRLTTARNELISSLEYARSEAVKRDSVATVVLNSNGTYTVQYPDNGATVTFSYGLPRGVSFVMPTGASAVTVRYAAPGKVTLTDNNGSSLSSIGLMNAAGQRIITISLAGNISSGSTGS
jgi:type II secretory pathway pseudopilin PulG